MPSPEGAADLAGDRVLVRPLNLLESESIHASVADAMDRFGSRDVLRRPFEAYFFGLLELTKAVLPVMRNQKRRAVVNGSAVGGHFASAFGRPYHSSEWAVEGLSWRTPETRSSQTRSWRWRLQRNPERRHRLDVRHRGRRMCFEAQVSEKPDLFFYCW